MKEEGPARVLRRLVFLVHAVLGAAWLYSMPGGFPLLHLRTLANRGLPMAVVLLSLVAIYADRTGRKTLLGGLTTFTAAAWLAASLVGFALFPISARYLAPGGLLVACVLFLLGLGRAELFLRGARLALWLLLLGIGMGVVAPFSQRAALPTTRPSGSSLEATPLAGQASQAPNAIQLKELRVLPSSGHIVYQKVGLSLSIDPMLTFVSCSPDRCWTLFAPYEMRVPAARELTSWSQNEDGVRFRYANRERSDLRISMARDGASEIEAGTELGVETYSHLNAYGELYLIGHTKLSIVFSPCPNQPIEVLPMDYPRGRPARCAYLDAHGIFHVVEATSGEKGPFHELASGKLDRTQALELTLLEAGRPMISISFADWASQVSTDLSPTAGWGLPQNAIEFALTGNNPRSAASLYITLASTSVGRGFDSVGHAPGVYRNRMTVRSFAP